MQLTLFWVLFTDRPSPKENALETLRRMLDQSGGLVNGFFLSDMLMDRVGVLLLTNSLVSEPRSLFWMSSHIAITWSQ